MNAFRSTCEVAAAIQTGRERSVDVLETCIEQLDRYNPTLNAVVTTDLQRARARAEAADRALANGTVWGPLHGVPFTVKDAYETAGVRTTCGHLPLSENIPDNDADVVERLLSAGAILVGKTNMPALAMDVQSENPLFGRTLNPWNPEHTCGGSSGGEAVAVACGMSSFGIGSDIGGSVRVPAHFCGVYALKPTEGRVSNRGHIFPGPVPSVRHLAATGPMARSAEDLALLLRVIESRPRPSDTHEPRPLSSLRLGWSPQFAGLPVSDAYASTLHAFVDRLRRAGATIVEITETAWDFESLWRTYGELFGVMAFANVSMPVRAAARTLGPLVLRDTISRSAARVAFANPRRYFRVLQQREALQAAVSRALAEVDAWITPVCCTAAPRHRTMGKIHTPSDVDGTRVPGNIAATGYTAPFNLLGLPAITMPLARTPEGLPVGVQVVGHHDRDIALVGIASTLARHAGRVHAPPNPQPNTDGSPTNTTSRPQRPV